MSKLLLTVSASIAAIALTPAASAATITFEGFSNAAYDNTTIIREGFEIGNVPGDEQHFHEIDSTQFGLASNGTGVLLNDRDTQIFLRASDLSAFALTSLDIAAAYGNGPATSFAVYGYLGNTLVGTLTGSLGDFQTFSGSTFGMGDHVFGTVDYVVFDGIGGNGGFELDNIVTGTAQAAPLPEPATWAMMVGGFGLIGSAMRRRKANVSFA